MMIDRKQIEIPLGQLREGYLPRKVEVRLDRDQAAVLRRLTDGLDEIGARLRDGRRVRTDNRADAIRYLIDAMLGSPNGQRPARRRTASQSQKRRAKNAGKDEGDPVGSAGAGGE